MLRVNKNEVPSIVQLIYTETNSLHVKYFDGTSAIIPCDDSLHISTLEAIAELAWLKQRKIRLDSPT